VLVGLRRREGECGSQLENEKGALARKRVTRGQVVFSLKSGILTSGALRQEDALRSFLREPNSPRRISGGGLRQYLRSG